MRFALAVAATFLLLASSAADAKSKDWRRIEQKLSKSRSKKVRLSAALSLAKSSRASAVLALSRSLKRDPSADVRRVAAATLGQKLQAGLKGSVRSETLDALRRASAGDRDKKVRAAASGALQKAASSPARRSSKGLVVGITFPKVSKKLPKTTASTLHGAIRTSLEASAPKGVHTAPGTGMPSSKALKRTGLRGVSIVPSVSKVKLKRRGKKGTLECAVELRITPWDGSELDVTKAATVSGAGSVATATTRSALAASTQDCVAAVAEQVTRRQVVRYLAKVK